MKKLDTLLINVVRNQSSKRSKRQIIVLKSKRDYHKCLKSLASAGIRPIKTVASHRMICCHFHHCTDLSALKVHPGVAYMQLDEKVKAHVIQCPVKAPWNVCRVKSPSLWNRTRGRGVKLAILDTGIAKHPDLNVVGGVNTITGGSYLDDNGHGTHVAGIAAATGKSKIYGNAPDVSLYAVKVLDKNGSGYISDIVQGIDWCLKRKIHVMNMSFGQSGGKTNLALKDAIHRAYRKNAVMAASAGNSGTAYAPVLDSPARLSETIAVAATDIDNRVADFSSRGKGIAVAAPGVDILSTLPGGKYGMLSGTSMSSPHVAGGAALLRGLYPSMNAAEVKRRLKSTAKRIKGGKEAVGSGLLQVGPAGSRSSTRTKIITRNSTSSVLLMVK